jgi:hypothetical protein
MRCAAGLTLAASVAGMVVDYQVNPLALGPDPA